MDKNALIKSIQRSYKKIQDKKELLKIVEQAVAEKWETLDLSDMKLTRLVPEIGELTHLTWFSLRHNEITELPPEIGQLTTLTELYLRDNKLRSLPPEIGNLNNLWGLSLTDNELKYLPAEIGQLSNLTGLSLGGNRLENLPPEIGQLTNLTGLVLDRNHLTKLPPEIGNLTHLTGLVLEQNQLVELPSQIGQLRNLTGLVLDHNHLEVLPLEMTGLTDLVSLELNYNHLTELPQDIGSLVNLTELELRGNNLNALPRSIGKLTNLARLDVRDNPLPIPPEILERVDQPKVIINYYLQHLEPAGKRFLREAKLLIVGQGGVGKTQIVNRLLYNDYNETEQKTEGIDIQQWHVVSDNKKIKLNVWDFGGQEIMHATHQFFLTKRSLYVLVWDARQEDRYGQINYWLKLIQSYGGDAPVIMALNKIDVGYIDLDERELMKKYPNIKAFINISCKTGRNIDQLKALITEEVGQLRHIDDKLLNSWFEVKTQLEQMTVDFMEYHEYERICQAHNIDQLSQETLINFLHDLGVVLNYQDDLRLRDTSILNPEWVTDGVYQILNHRPLAGSGVLNSSDLSEILNPERYPRNKHHFIINMMQKFELCFELTEQSGVFLIPELLPTRSPDFEWNYQDCLRFQYHYNFFPMSMMSRFIVRMHSFIDEGLNWKSGVVLSDKHNRALVKADRDERRIDIWVSGINLTRRDLLAKIRANFEHIHTTIPRIEPREIIPLYADKNIGVDYNYLIGLESRGKRVYTAPETFEDFDIQELLAGIGRPLHRFKELQDQFNMLNYKVHRLRSQFEKTSNVAIKFKLEKELAQAEQECSDIKAEMDRIDRRKQ